jgi:hypothetical protein
VEQVVASGVLETFTFVHQQKQDVGLARNDLVPQDDPFLPVVKAFQEARRLLRPIVTAEKGTDKEDVQAEEALERVATVLRVPIKGATCVVRTKFGERYYALLFEGIESYGHIRYKYLLPVFDGKNQAILCVVSVEQSPALDGLKPEWLKALGISGNEVLGLWSREGHATVEMSSWPDSATFLDRARPLVESMLPRDRADEPPTKDTTGGVEMKRS